MLSIEVSDDARLLRGDVVDCAGLCAGLCRVRLAAAQNPGDLNGADGIVVLTGGETRLDRAVALFESGVGKRLLISGVDETTTKETLKHSSMVVRASIAAPIWAMRPRTHVATPRKTAHWARAP